MTVLMAVAVVVPMIMAVPMVRVPVPAQDHKDERVDPDAHQSQNKHHCTPQRMLNITLSLL